MTGARIHPSFHLRIAPKIDITDTRSSLRIYRISIHRDYANLNSGMPPHGTLALRRHMTRSAQLLY